MPFMFARLFSFVKLSEGELLTMLVLTDSWLLRFSSFAIVSFFIFIFLLIHLLQPIAAQVANKIKKR